MKPCLKIFFDGDYTWVGVVLDNPKGRGTITHYSKLESLRGGRNEAITVMCGDCLCNGNYYYNDYLQG